MKRSALTIMRAFIIVCLCLATLSGCSKSSGNSDNQNPGEGSAKPYTVTGVAKDAKGNPIAGAKVRIENDFTYYDVTTDAQGRYTSPKLSQTNYKVVAWYTTSYKGQSYTLRLGMPNDTDYDYVDVTKGAVRNFVQKIQGRIPDRSETETGMGLFGGTLLLSNGTGLYDMLSYGDRVDVVLTPTGPLLDGSTTQTLSGYIIIGAISQYYLTDIPVGEYVVTATVTRGSAQGPVKLGTLSSLSQSQTIVFPSSGYGIGTYESGLTYKGLHMAL
jgi:hypothetical protein